MLNRVWGLPLHGQVACLGGCSAAAVLLTAAWVQGLAGLSWGWALAAAAAGIAGACWPAQRATGSAGKRAAVARAGCPADDELATPKAFEPSFAAGERSRIAQDLHDAVSQNLFASSLLAGTLARSDTLDPALRQQAQTLENLNRSALAEMRMMLFELRPDALEGVRLGHLLQQATQALSGRGGLQVQTDLAPDPNLPSPLRIEVYRIAQEALSNIGRHSGARHAQISWRLRGPAQGVLRIADDGCGFDPGDSYPGHFGLENMRHRAQKLGSALQIRSAPGQGCELVLDLHWNT